MCIRDRYLAEGEVITVKYTITVTDDSGAGNAAETQEITLTITGTNDAPVIESVSTPDTIDDTDAADRFLTNVTGSVVVTDADSTDTLTYAIDDGLGHETASLAGTYGTLSIDSNGVYTYVVDAAAVNALKTSTSETFSLVVRDPYTGLATQTVTFAITAANDTFTSADDSKTATEDTDASGNVLTNDILDNRETETLKVTEFFIGQTSISVPDDATGATGYIIKVGTTFSLADAASATASENVGAITFRSDGSYTFKPALNWNGTIPGISYTAIEDGNAAHSSTAILTITVDGTQDSFVALNGSKTAEEDAEAVLSGNVLDSTDLDNVDNVDGGSSETLTLTAASVGGVDLAFDTDTLIAGKGVLHLNSDGSYTFAQVENWYGTLEIDFTAADQADPANTSIAKFTITVNSVNDTFVAQSDSRTIAEDTVASITGTVLGTTNAANVDNVLGSSESLTITAATVGAQSLVLGQVNTIAGKGDLVLNSDGTYTFTQVTNWNGTLSIAFTAADADPAHTSSSTFTIVVTAVNDAVVAVADEASGLQNQVLRGNVLANDTDVEVSRDEAGAGLRVVSFTVNGVTRDAGRNLTIAGVGTITISNLGAYTFTPVTGYTNSAATPLVVSYVVRDLVSSTDGSRTTGQNTLSIVINNPPDTDPGVDEALEDNAITGSLTDFAHDVNVGQTLTFGSFKVDGNFESDGVTLTTYNPGDVIVIDQQGTLVFQANGSYVFTPVADFNGSVPTIQYTVTDGTAFVTDVLNLTITSVNDGPVLQDTTDVGTEDFGLSGNVLHDAFDVEGDDIFVDSFVVQGVTKNAGDSVIIGGKGTLQVNRDGSYSFTPVANWNGIVDQVTIYGVDDLGTVSAPVMLRISITAVNDAPVTSDDFGQRDEDQQDTNTVRLPVSGNVLSNDSDVEGSSMRIVNFTVEGVTYTFDNSTTVRTVAVGVAGAIGSLTFNRDGSYAFLSAPNWNGTTPAIVYGVTDGEITSTADLVIVISSVNDLPVLGDDVIETTKGIAQNGSLYGNDFDAEDGTNLTVTEFTVNGTTYNAGVTASLADRGTLLIRANGTYVFTPDGRYLGGAGADGLFAVVTYTAVDSGGLAATATITLRTNDAPTGTPTNLTFLEDSTYGGNLLAGNAYDLNGGSLGSLVNDINGDSLTVKEFTIGTTTVNAGQSIHVDGVGDITVEVNGDVTLSLVQDFNSKNGTFPQISYVVTDGLLDSDANTADFRVIQDNDAPEIVAETNYTIVEDTTTPITNIFITDVDSDEALNAVFTVTLTVGKGTLTVEDLSNSLTFDTGFESGHDVVRFSGSKLAVNTALATLSYVPLANNNIADSLVVQVTDNGAGSPNGSTATTDSKTIALNITATADDTTARTDAATTSEPGIIYGNILNDDLTYDSDVDTDASLNASPSNITVQKFYYLDANGVEQEATSFPAGFELYAQSQHGSASTFVKVGDFSIGTNGAYIFVSTQNWNGDLVLGYVSGDGNSSSGRTTLTLTVEGTDDPTTANNDTDNVNEASQVLGNVLTNDTDIDTTLDLNKTPSTLSVTKFAYISDDQGTVLEYTIGDPAVTVFVRGNNGAGYVAAGSLEMLSDGSYTFTGSANYNGSVEVTYTVLDSTTGATPTTAKLTVYVSQVDDAPSATGHVGTGDEEGSITGNILTGSFDVDADAQLNTNPTTTYITSLIYMNAAGNSATAYDFRFGPIEVYKAAGIKAGSITINAATGEYTFVGALDFNGTLDLQFTVGDNASSSNPATLSLTVNEVNDLTDAVNDTINVDEGDHAAGGSSVGLADFEDGLLSGWSNRYWNGNTWITLDPDVTVIPGDRAGFGNTADGAWSEPAIDGKSITIKNGDKDFTTDVLWARSQAFLLGAGDITLDAKGGNGNSDVAPTTEEEVLTSADGNGWAGVVIRDANTGAFLLTQRWPAAFGGGLTMVISQSDLAAFVGRSVTIDIIDSYAGGWGWIAFDNVRYPQVSLKSGNLLANDSDVDTTAVLNADPLTISVQSVSYENIAGQTVQNPADGSAFDVYRQGYNGAGGWTKVGTMTVAANGAYTFDPYGNFSGTVSLTYAVSDGRGSKSFASIDINVAQVNDATVATNDLVDNAQEGQQNVSGNVLTNDTDLDTVAAYNASQSALKVQTFSYLDSNGSSQTYTAGAAAVDVYVLGHDDVTFVKAGSLAMSEDGDYSFNASADYNGDVTVTYSVKDTAVGSVAVTADLTIKLAQVDDQPTAATDNGGTGLEAGDITGNLLNSSFDPDTDTALNVTATTLSVKELTYVNALGATVSTEDFSAAIAIYKAAGVKAGDLTINALTGAYTFTGTADFNGSLTLGYKVGDNVSSSFSTVLSFTVNQDGDKTASVNEANSVSEDATVSGNFLTNNTDVDTTRVLNVAPTTVTVKEFYYRDINGDEQMHSGFPATSISVYAAGQNGTTGFYKAGEITVNADGSYDFTATDHWNGTLVLGYVSGDGVGENSDRANLTITVNAANDVTVATNDLVPNAKEGDQNVTGNVLDNDFDHDTVGAYNATPSALKVQTFSYLDSLGASQTYTAGAAAVDVYVLGHDDVTFVKAGSLAMSEDGDYSFNASADYNGDVTVTYSVKDLSLIHI